MLETIFFLDKIVLGWITNPVNGFSTLTALWLVTEVYCAKKKNNKKKGGK